MKHNSFFVLTLCILFYASISLANRAAITTVSAEPYRSAILLNAATGETLFEKNADAQIYPASTLKLMVLLVVLEQIERGTLQLDDMVQITVEASRMGGSQVYLDPKEQFPVEDLLYALMIQSANDAAVALAIHIAGSKDGFVAMMNQKAQELGMKNTRFYSVHGLPPAKGQGVDVSTARDFGTLSRHLSTKPEVFLYTSARVRDFRDGEFVMRTHNHLLEDYNGCDGLKTGYFVKAGFSIAATAKRSGVRIIAIVMGSKNRNVRDAKAIELLAKGFTMVPPTHEALVKLVTGGQQQEPAQPLVEVESSSPVLAPVIQEKIEPTKKAGSGWSKFFIGLVLGFLLYGALDYFLAQRKKKRNWRYR